jgi:hypothetical protein
MRLHRNSPLALAALLLLLTARPAPGLVNYDLGQRTIRGVQLLQDFNDPKAYYYVPQYPRLASKSDGSLELLCLKYVDAAGGASGGLFHALIEYTLPPDVLEELDAELKKQVPGARIVGPVQLMQAAADGEEGMGSFRVVSAILTNRDEGGFTRQLITSGKAPLTPGSRAVVAALLNQKGATLLWDSLTGPTSDVSVAISAYYEAAVQGYNARVFAEMSTVYDHFSRVINRQQGYKKRQLRKIVDDMRQNGTLKVEVVDRTQGLGIKAGDMEGILQVVTDKLTELMFDHTNGWAAEPEREVAVEANQIQGRQDRGWFARTFLGADDTKYYTDDQYVMKDRRDIRQNTFNLMLAKSSTIKVPVDTAGNLGGLYKALKEDRRYFRVVNLDDPAFEFRTVHFQVDGGYLDSFQDTINFVAVSVRKTYGDRPPFTRALQFTSADIKAGKTLQDVAFPRLGDEAKNWTEYEYQVRWSLRDRPTLNVPPQADKWLRSSDAAISLVPPFERRVIELDADRALFAERGVSTALIEFATVLAGKPWIASKAVLRANDAEAVSHVSIYGDRGEPMGIRVTWNAPDRKVQGALEPLENDYVFLTPPQPLPPPEGGTR